MTLRNNAYLDQLIEIFKSENESYKIKRTKGMAKVNNRKIGEKLNSDNECVIYDLPWFGNKMPTFIDKCNKIVFSNVYSFDISKNITITKDIMIKSSLETNLSFKNDSMLIIK